MNLPPKKPRPLKDKHLDQAFSLLIRCRSGWRCDHCGKVLPEGAHNLHCSHFYGRRNRALRWSSLNCWSHCANCHRIVSESPAYFTEWVQSKLGSNYDVLRLQSQVITKRSKADKRDLYEEMLAKLEWMMEERRKGNLGRLEFEL